MAHNFDFDEEMLMDAIKIILTWAVAIGGSFGLGIIFGLMVFR